MSRTFLEAMPAAIPIADGLYRVAGEPVDVYIECQERCWLVFAALRPLPTHQGGTGVLRYLLERNRSPSCRPGAFALREGNIIYRVYCERVDELEAACRVVRQLSAVYGPKVLRMT